MTPQNQDPTYFSSSCSSTACSSFFTTKPKLKFFSRIRRFLNAKTVPAKRPEPVDLIETTTEEEEEEEEEEDNSMDKIVIREGGLSGSVERYGAVQLQRSVKRLHFGRSLEEKEEAMEEIRRMAREGGVRVRKSLAELGVIPVLVSMIGGGSAAVGRRRLAVHALIELADGTLTNKAIILNAGIFSKLPNNVDMLDESTTHEFARLLLSLTSLANIQCPARIIPFLGSVLESSVVSVEDKELCLGTLYNLSTTLENATVLVNNGAVSVLLRMASTNKATEKALATLGNLAVTLAGKKALENDEMVPASLIEMMTWEDKPKCQELCAYILMVLAHQSSEQRVKMAKAGIVQVLLELALLGSPLAQKRAVKLLQWFKNERQTKMGPHSGPQTGRVAIGSPLNQRETQEGKRMMKNLVKQSLHRNMEVITRRASGGEDPSKAKALILSSSSKSLPY